MAVRLDDNFFSTSSSASVHLVQALKQQQSDAAARHTIRHFNRYTEGLSEIANLNNPTRDEVLLMWHRETLYKAKDKLLVLYDKANLPFHEYENILMHKLRRAREHGAILERMRYVPK
jgi:hypothetical protein